MSISALTWQRLLLILSAVSVTTRVHGHSFGFTSTHKLLQLSDFEVTVLSSAREAFEQEPNSWPLAFRTFVTTAEQERRQGSRGEMQYALLPVNQYRLIRRFVFDWPAWMVALEKHTNRALNISWFLSQYRGLFFDKGSIAVLPSNALAYAAEAICVLQLFYGSSTHFIAGKEQNLFSRPHFTPFEMLEISSSTVEPDREDFSTSQRPFWISEALAAVRRLTPCKTDSQCFDLLLQTEDNSIKAPDCNLTIPEAKRRELRQITNELATHIAEHQDFLDDAAENFVELHHCNSTVDRTYRSDLYCFYFAGLLGPYAPFRYEILSERPYVALIHKLLYPSFAEKIIDSSVPTLSVSDTATDEGSRAITLDTRLSEGGHIDGNQELTKWMERQIHAATLHHVEFDNELPASGESLSVINYGIGGFYTSHFDHFNDSLRHWMSESGDRLATVMTYLSDTELGGNTAFPNLNISVRPETGKAVFWYNLDMKTRKPLHEALHAACPVAEGSKWIINKWIREIRNEGKTPPTL